jgi:RES domain-containing protein
VHPGPDPAVATVRWRKAWRIIASRYPPIHLFERLSPNPAVWDVLIELEQITNPRVRDETGQISLVPPERRVSGPNATYVMAPFTHVNPKGSRFSDGTFGVYYAANRLKTAIAETAHHFARFARDANDPPRREDVRVLLGSISNTFHDVQTISASQCSAILDPGSYAASRSFGIALRQAGSNGIVYPSVRDPGGRCVAAFWPNVVGIPVQERHLQYDWDGQRISRYFDFSLGEWFAL